MLTHATMCAPASRILGFETLCCATANAGTKNMAHAASTPPSKCCASYLLENTPHRYITKLCHHLTFNAFFLLHHSYITVVV